MMKREMIGIDRRLDIEWLDAVAALIAQGKSVAEIRERITQLMAPNQGREATEKTLIVLGRLWWRAPEKLTPMQARALELLPVVDPANRVAVHWALFLAVYPLFMDTARLTGRLLGLQREVKLQQLNARVAELWGDRPTIPRAVQRIVRSMVQWGVLSDTEHSGVYVASPKRPVEGDLAALLLEGLLHSQSEGGLTSDQLLGHPVFFPFELNVRPYELMPRPEFTVFRQGVDTSVVMLRQ